MVRSSSEPAHITERTLHCRICKHDFFSAIFQLSLAVLTVDCHWDVFFGHTAVCLQQVRCRAATIVLSFADAKLL